MLLVALVLLVYSTKNIGEAISCPYLSLTSGAWRDRLISTQRTYRFNFARGMYHSSPQAEQMNNPVWSCETEYNLKKIQQLLPGFTSNVTYRSYGVNTAEGNKSDCYLPTMYILFGKWFATGITLSSLVYDGDPRTRDFANMAKWNSTEFACTFGSYDSGNVVLYMCAYNVKGAVVGEAIYEEAKNGKYACDEGTQCGTDGKCERFLCNVPVSHPDTILPIYTPALLCNDLPFMSQFSRYYALNQHNFYRRLVASGWAENKLTRFTSRAAKMEALSYDCSLEKTASENVRKCERGPNDGENSADTGSNVQIIDGVNMTKEAALERAIDEWFSQLRMHGMDPNSAWTGDTTLRNSANIMYDKYKSVGCAVNTCSSEGFTVVECRYGPKSLQKGTLIYEVGVPCSKCESTQNCVYGVLCQ